MRNLLIDLSSSSVNHYRGEKVAFSDVISKDLVTPKKVISSVE